MDKKLSGINRIISYICIAVTLVMFISIAVRIFSRQILVEKYGINNELTNAVFFDAVKLRSGVTHYDNEKTDWEVLYPFVDRPLDSDTFDDYSYESEAATDDYAYETEDSFAIVNGGMNEIESPDLLVTDNSAFGKLSGIVSKYLKLVDSLKEKIEAYSSEYLMGHDFAANLAADFDNLIMWKNPVSPQDFNRIITMENGYLTYVQPKLSNEQIEEMATGIKDFENFLKERDIPLLVVNNGSKVCPNDTQLSDFESQFEHTNENGDMLLEKLNELDVNVLDMRREMMDANLNWYDYYYKTDHHFTTNAGLFAAGKIAKKLNEVAGADYDLSIFDDSNYEMTVYKNIMFGGEGRAVTLANAKPEDYTLILPKFDTNLTLNVLEERIELEGSYEEALFDRGRLESINEYSKQDYLTSYDAYSTIRLFNSPVSLITNNEPPCNENLRVLLIQDSFSWYSTSFLSLATAQIDVIYPIAFNGSIRNYVEENKPDIVVFSFCQKAIDPIDYERHDTYFDLR